MTDLLTNPIDSSDIPALPGGDIPTLTRILLPGEAVTRDLAFAVERTLVRPYATGEHPTYSPEPGEPPRPLPVPPPVPGPPPPAAAETETLTLLDSLGTDPETPRPLPAPGPPPTPAARHAWNQHRAGHYPIVRPATVPDIPRAWAPRRHELAPWKVALSAAIATVVAEALILGSILAVAL